MGKSSGPFRAWITRAGGHGEDEAAALDRKLAIIGFRGVPDLSSFQSVNSLIEAMQARSPESPKNRHVNFARQLWQFRQTMQIGDIVVMPMKTRQNRLTIGRCSGPYKFMKIDGEERHVRAVDWIRLDIPRTEIQQDLLYSLGAFMTVCEVRRNDAANRLAAVLEGRPDPGFVGDTSVSTTDSDTSIDTESSTATRVDLERTATDEITSFIRERFPGHDLTRLVEGILVAQGFVTFRSPPGPDGGVDILAGRGGLGLDAPFLAVQVKARQATSDVTELRELVGSMDHFKATQGLFVSWSGYTRAAEQFARQQFFKVRLWTADDLVAALFGAYDKLDAEIQAELPLKKTWVLVRENVEGD